MQLDTLMYCANSAVCCLMRCPRYPCCRCRMCMLAASAIEFMCIRCQDILPHWLLAVTWPLATYAHASCSCVQGIFLQSMGEWGCGDFPARAITFTDLFAWHSVDWMCNITFCYMLPIRDQLRQTFGLGVQCVHSANSRCQDYSLHFVQTRAQPVQMEF